MSTDRADAGLLKAAMAGDGSAFAELIRPEYPAAFRLAYWLLRNNHEAEDAVQEAAFKAWRRLGTFQLGSPLRPWFLAIVANQCRSVQRGRWWATIRKEPVEAEVEATDVAAMLDLQRGLLRLGHDERLILVLRYYLDLPFEEIAATLGISPKAARTRVARAVKRLRPMLQMKEVMG